MNNEPGQEIGIEELHQVQLKLLKLIAGICDEQNLTYYLCWGTLIGAIRHNGFIPWDDDVDIVMLRPDYEKLIAYLAAHERDLRPVRLMHYSTNKQYIYSIARVCDTRYTIHSDDPGDCGLGVFIDIYPLDGWGNTKEDSSIYFRKMHPERRDYYYATKSEFPPHNESKWKNVYKRILYRRARLLGVHRIIKRWDEKAKKQSVETAKYIGNLNWAQNERERIEKSDLVPIKHRFEDAEFTIPMGYDRILRNYYGNYMQYPPEEERSGHHCYKAFRVRQAQET